MAVSYIPPREADFVIWTQNFSSYISANYAALGLTLSDATALASMTNDYIQAYNDANAGSTRGPMTIATKDAQRANVTAKDRMYATIIQANPTISDATKTALGITVRKTNKTPIPPPTSSPLLAFVAATPLQHTLRFSDQLTPALKQKPFGVTALQLSVWIYTPVTPPPPPGPPSPPTLVLNATRNPFAVNFDSSNVRQVAYYQAQWMTAKGELGPVSNNISAVIV